MHRFEFASAQQIIFGAETVAELGSHAAGLGNRALLVVGSGSVPLEGLLQDLSDHRLDVQVFRVSHEPTLDVITRGVDFARNTQRDLVIGFGGGSVMDSAKAIGVLLANPGSLLDYLEVVGPGRPLTQPGCPVICLPTTAGTGAEVTRNAVLAVPERRVKVSMRGRFLLPTLAIVDPLLTVSAPPAVTAASGMDALVQNLEAYVSAAHNPLTDGISCAGLARAAACLLPAFLNGGNVAAREGMAQASLFGGISLANAGLGAVHGLAGVLGGFYKGAPHGALCGRLLPAVMRANLQALAKEGEGSFYLERYREIARILSGEQQADPQDGVAWAEELLQELALPKLREMGARREEFPEIAAKAQEASSMKKNPVRLSTAVLVRILEEAF